MILGIVIGETLALKVFGRVESVILNIIDMVVFIVSLNWIFSRTDIISSLFPYLSYPLYFSFSFLLIFFIRGLTTFGGLKGKPSKQEKVKRTIDKAIEAMLNAGFSKTRIKKVLKEAEFNDALIENKLSGIKEESYIPVTLEKLDKIEKSLEELKEKLEN